MVFARRVRPSISTKLREALWPRSGYRRAAKYVGYRVLRLPGTPHSISGGFAWGAAISFTPFIGLHLALAALGAWLTRCSIIASVVGTAVGNFWTMPLILAWIYQCGIWMLGGDLAEVSPMHSLGALFAEMWHLLGASIEWMVGLRPNAGPSEFVDLSRIGHLVRAVLWPMVVGAIPNALVVWFAFYVAFKYLVIGYRRTRAARRRVQGPVVPLEDGDVPNI